MENKTGRYFKYAIGEIVLVVIGILIAVSINSYYNKVQNEEKIKTILTQVQRELLTDMKDAKRIFNTYVERDSLAKRIYNDSLTLESIRENQHNIAFKYSYVSFSNKKAGYEQLLQNIENLPEKYAILLPDFNNIFREIQNEVDDYNTQIKAQADNNWMENFETNPEFSEYLTSNFAHKNSYKIIENPYLKNSTMSFMNSLGNIAQASNLYRIEGIHLYKKIDSLLNRTPESYPEIFSFLPKEEVVSQILGTYKIIDSNRNNLPTKISLEVKNGKLQFISLDDDSIIELYWNEKDTYFDPIKSGVFKIYKNEKDQQIIAFSNSIIFATFLKD